MVQSSKAPIQCAMRRTHFITPATRITEKFIKIERRMPKIVDFFFFSFSTSHIINVTWKLCLRLNDIRFLTIFLASFSFDWQNNDKSKCDDLLLLAVQTVNSTIIGIAGSLHPDYVNFHYVNDIIIQFNYY